MESRIDAILQVENRKIVGFAKVERFESLLSYDRFSLLHHLFIPSVSS